MRSFECFELTALQSFWWCGCPSSVRPACADFAIPRRTQRPCASPNRPSSTHGAIVPARAEHAEMRDKERNAPALHPQHIICVRWVSCGPIAANPHTWHTRTHAFCVVHFEWWRAIERESDQRRLCADCVDWVCFRERERNESFKCSPPRLWITN